MWMRERGDGARLAHDCQRLIAASSGFEQFDRDIAIEPRIVGAINFAHPART